MRQSNASLSESLLPREPDDVLAMDELVTFVIGDRSETTAQKLWQAIPESYRGCPVFTDQFNVYPLIVPPEQHHPVPKGAGLTNHQERWYNTLRQWVGRYTRRTLSFSKEDRCHELVTRWFILQHNLMIRDASCTM